MKYNKVFSLRTLSSFSEGAGCSQHGGHAGKILTPSAGITPELWFVEKQHHQRFIPAAEVGFTVPSTPKSTESLPALPAPRSQTPPMLTDGTSPK